MGWDYKQCVDFLRKNASAADFRDLMRTASRPYTYKHTKISLTYYSMPDWLAILDVAALPGAAVPTAAGPVDAVLRAMSVEAVRPAVGAVIVDSLEPAARKRAFASLVAAYRSAAKTHQDGVAGCLDQIVRYRSGQALLMELGRTGHAISVIPYWHFFMTMPGKDFCNSTSDGLLPGQSLSHITDGIPANYNDIYAKGAPVRGDNNEPVGGKGTGKGANVVLYFSAGTWTDADCSTTDPGFQADEVLFHELAHITRMIRGQETHIAVEGRPNFGNIEEYFATVIANIYMSEKGQDARLRGVYSMGKPNPPKNWSVMKEPDKFFKNVDGLSITPSQLMDMFSGTQKEFYKALALLPTPPKFNPVREHFNMNQRPPV